RNTLDGNYLRNICRLCPANGELKRHHGYRSLSRESTLPNIVPGDKIVGAYTRGGFYGSAISFRCSPSRTTILGEDSFGALRRGDSRGGPEVYREESPQFPAGQQA